MSRIAAIICRVDASAAASQRPSDALQHSSDSLPRPSDSLQRSSGTLQQLSAAGRGSSDTLPQYLSRIFGTRSLLPTNTAGHLNTSAFSSDDTRVWRFFIEKYFLPVNAKIRQLVLSKMHLLSDGVLPKTFGAFLDHETRFEALHRLWKATGRQQVLTLQESKV